MPNPKEKEYLVGLVELARAGWDPWGPYVHAYCETEGFGAVIGECNYWGVERPKEWNGPVIRKFWDRWNVPRGEYVKTKVEFVDWRYTREAVAWYEQIIRQNYLGAYKWRSFATVYLRELVECDRPWSNDPYYSARLRKSYSQAVVNVDLVRAINDIIEVAKSGGILTFT